MHKCIIMNYLPKSNGKDNGLNSRLCLSCNDECRLDPFGITQSMCA